MRRKAYHFLSIGLVLLYLFVPLLATTLYAFSDKWSNTVLPQGLTLRWFSELFADPDFVGAIVRSLLLSSVSLFLSVVITVPAIIAIVLYVPKWERIVQALVVLTYAMPGVIMAVGLIRAYSDFSVPMIAVVAGAYFVTVLPTMYQGVRNSLQTLDAKSLMESAELLGAGRFTALRTVIVPNVMPGLVVSALLSFSILFGEFVIANLVAGGQFETVQIYLYSKLRVSGHLSSAITVCYFLVMAIVSAAIVKGTGHKKEDKTSY
jgi:putative spermidine/putrescine transport system permease protein